MSNSLKVIIGIVVIAAVLVVALAGSLFERNDNQNWQICQYINGEVRVVDKAGYYWQGFGTVWTYPRYIEFRYNDDPDDGDEEKESVRVTFNDSGNAQIATYVRLGTPVVEDERRAFHQQFAGNLNNFKAAIKSHMNNCLKSTAPLMSSSENQSARKAEFSQIVENQMSDGLYEMRKVERTLRDRYDEQGKPITVWATEVILDSNGKPIIAQESPITSGYKASVIQFSVTGTDYDDQTLRSFAMKKESFLAAESAKAEREQMVQERLKIEEQGKRDKATAEAAANVEKAKAVIAAQQKAEVALQTKIEAETKANQLLEVAKIEKNEAETRANKELEVAKILAMAAQQEKLATIARAEGKQKAIELSGDITEKEKVLAQIMAERDVRIAAELSQIQVPSTVFVGGGEGGSGNYFDNLLSYCLAQNAGLLKSPSLESSDAPVSPKSK